MNLPLLSSDPAKRFREIVSVLGTEETASILSVYRSRADAAEILPEDVLVETREHVASGTYPERDMRFLEWKYSGEQDGLTASLTRQVEREFSELTSAGVRLRIVPRQPMDPAALFLHAETAPPAEFANHRGHIEHWLRSIPQVSHKVEIYDRYGYDVFLDKIVEGHVRLDAVDRRARGGFEHLSPWAENYQREQDVYTRLVAEDGACQQRRLSSSP